jgi:hypothetical protein
VQPSAAAAKLRPRCDGVEHSPGNRSTTVLSEALPMSEWLAAATGIEPVTFGVRRIPVFTTGEAYARSP